MTKCPVELKNCTENASAFETRAPYTISRRGFLGGSAAVVLPVIYGGCTNATPGPPIVDLPPMANKKITIPFSDFPDLMKLGGSLVGRSSGYRNPIVIAQPTQGMFVALDAICTHMNCTVSYNALNVELDCPCHGSTYEVDGTVIGGPAPLPLTSFTASSDGTSVTVTLP